MSWPLLLQAIVVWTACAMCGGGSGAAGLPAVPDSRDAHTASYFEEALDPAWLFRWTPVAADGVVDLYVEVANAPGELPPGVAADLTPGDVQGMVRDALDVWLNAAGDESMFRTHFAFHADGQAHPPDRTAIEIRFVEGPQYSFGGIAQLDTRGADPILVDGATVEIRVPLGGVDVPMDSYRALMLHEIGHVLGIIAHPPFAGHSAVRDDVMYSVAQWTTLSDGDRATVAELYEREPVLLRSDGQAAVTRGGGDGPRTAASTIRLHCGGAH